jgi:hypothetical protein
MKEHVARRLALAGLATVLVLPSTGLAQNVNERLSQLEKKVEEQGKSIAGLLGVDIHALVSTVYQYSFNKPDGNVELRSFALNHDNIDLHQASLFVSRMKEDESFGFKFVTDFGEEAEALGAATAWGSSGESDNSFELREAFLTYKVPIGDGITLKGGKFVTLMGYEIIPTYDNPNPNITRSVLFGFGIPFTHTGLTANMPLGDMVTFEVGVVNGWDNPDDNNKSKSLLGGIGISPMDQLSMYFAGSYGPELSDNNTAQRGVVTANIVYTATDQLTFVLDGVYGNESDRLTSRQSDKDPAALIRHADWYGGVAYAIVQFTDELSLALRGEIFDDPDGVRTGIGGLRGKAPGGTLWGVTPTISYRLTDNILARVEYRHDEASEPFFNKDGERLLPGNDSVAGQLSLMF